MTRLAVAAQLQDCRGRLLAVRRAAEPFVGHWALPGGTVESWETPEEALRRELEEEVAVRVERMRYLGAHWYERHSAERTLTMLYAVETQDEPVNAEPRCHSEIDWIDNSVEHLAPTAAFALASLNDVKSHEGDALIAEPVDLLLLQPFFPLADKEALSIPLGLASLDAIAATLDVSVATLDCSLTIDYDMFANHLDAFSPRILGVQFHSAMSYDFALRTCARVQREVPAALVVAGGEVATMRYEQLLRSGYIDLVILGEGEDTFKELLGQLLNGDPRDIQEISGVAYLDRDGSIIVTPSRDLIVDLDRLPPPRIESFRWQHYGQWSMFTSRGCRYRCSYCSSAAFWQYSIRYHSPVWVKENFDRLKRFGAKDIYIADDTFTQNRSRVHEICELIKSLNMRWSCLTRVDCLDSKLLEAMASAGCRQISFGFETANDDTLQIVTKRSRVSRAERTLNECAQFGIRTRASVIVPLPGETEEHVRNTIDWLERIRPNEVQLYGLTPHDGTRMYDNLDALGVQILVDDPLRWSRNILDPICQSQQLDREAIIALALECVERLTKVGYVYLDEELPVKKIGADYTVATAFSPVQSIGGVNV